MKTLTISSQKGGVGKTTVSINLSYALARRGWHVLLVDTDPQGAVGLSLSRRARLSRGFFDVLIRGDRVADILMETRLPELKVLTVGQREGFESVMTNGAGGDRVYDFFTELETIGFDLVIVDTAAGVFGLTAEVMRCSDYVLIPQQAEPLGVRSIPQILQVVADLREEPDSSGLEVAGVLLTMTQREREESFSVAQELRGMMAPGMVTDTEIPRDELFIKASAKGVPASLLYKQPPAAAVAFDHLAAEIEERMRLGQMEEKHEYSQLMD